MDNWVKKKQNKTIFWLIYFWDGIRYKNEKKPYILSKFISLFLYYVFWYSHRSLVKYYHGSPKSFFLLALIYTAKYLFSLALISTSKNTY